MNAEHFYVSTACQHLNHEACRKFCKYCGAPCLCPICEHPKIFSHRETE